MTDIKYMTEEEQTKFWERHRKSREKIDRDFAKLPQKKKAEILGKMRACHEAMRNAKRIK